MDISLTDPMTWIVIVVAPVIIVAARWGLRSRAERRGRDPDAKD
jgi:hypothetical protein